MEEFNLSQKIPEEIRIAGFSPVYTEEDVKEFIKRLKEIVLLKGRRSLPDIDELAGDKLI